MRIMHNVRLPFLVLILSLSVSHSPPCCAGRPKKLKSSEAMPPCALAKFIGCNAWFARGKVPVLINAHHVSWVTRKCNNEPFQSLNVRLV